MTNHPQCLQVDAQQLSILVVALVLRMPVLKREIAIAVVSIAAAVLHYEVADQDALSSVYTFLALGKYLTRRARQAFQLKRAD